MIRSMKALGACVVSACLAACASGAAPADMPASVTRAPRPPHVVARLDVTDSAPGAPVVRGDVSLDLPRPMSGVITLDARGFEDVVATSTPPAEWSYDGERITGTVLGASEERVVLRVRYTARPERGVTVAEDAIWTSFHTWEWLPCVSAPGWRATLDLTVRAPQGWTTIATGDGAGRPGSDLVLTSPHPAYTFGFAAGVFEGAPHASGLDVWGAAPEQAERVRGRTREAIDRWRDAFGLEALPDGRYVQVFVPGRAYQELAGMAFMSRSYLDVLEADPGEDWLVVHELAHQRWGNLVTCATWGDFWLNEAIVTWWVARDKLLRGDDAGHARELSLWEARVAGRLERGDDPRIARPGSGHEGAGGGVVYNAGARLVARLERMVGPERFAEVLGGFMRRASAGGERLSTGAFLDALELTPAQRAQVECRLVDAGADCFE